MFTPILNIHYLFAIPGEPAGGGGDLTGSVPHCGYTVLQSGLGGQALY